MNTMTYSQYNNTSGISSAANPLRSLSPKTITAIVLMALMGMLWLRVLTGGQTGPSAAQAAEEALAAAASKPTETAVHVKPVELPVLEGRHDVLASDFFSSSNWPGFRTADQAPEPPDESSEQQRRQKAFVDELTRTLNLDAILHTGNDPAPRACIQGHVLSQGQTLIVKKDNETYELTVSEIGENRVVLTWDQWSVVLKMAESEHVD